MFLFYLYFPPFVLSSIYNLMAEIFSLFILEILRVRLGLIPNID